MPVAFIVCNSRAGAAGTTRWTAAAPTLPCASKTQCSGPDGFGWSAACTIFQARRRPVYSPICAARPRQTSGDVQWQIKVIVPVIVKDRRRIWAIYPDLVYHISFSIVDLDAKHAVTLGLLHIRPSVQRLYQFGC